MVRLLELIEPVLSALPEVERPPRNKPQQIADRLLWTGLALFIYLVCSQVPLFGVKPQGPDPYYWMRVILASSRGTLMELGVSPIITSSFFLQFARSRYLAVDERSPRDRRLFQGLQKLVAILLTLGQAVLYVGTGMYGDWRTLGTVRSLLIVMQLTLSGVLCILMDEMLQRGYGFGSGVSLFVCTNVCEQIVWRCFSPLTVNVGRGTEFEGAVVALFHQMLQNTNKVKALKDAFYRPYLPNLMGIVSTGVVFLVVVLLHSIGMNVPTVHSQSRQPMPQKIRLLYTSNMPVVLLAAFTTNLYAVTQMLHTRYPDHFFVRFLGVWETPKYSLQAQHVPVGGLVYLISPPGSISELLRDPFHGVFYSVFVLVACTVLSSMWVSISGQSAAELVQQYEDRGLSLPGHHKQQLQRSIPTAASLGGLCVGALTLSADYLGAVGSGTGILLAVSFIYESLEALERENAVPKVLKIKS
eukprot:Hpha_TRINITY_DN8389_c0_g1::TRINITY_DN8389_c0_g1_i2::g.154271::m.154271/K10956/SEC61A; protein transport protein SEC61 subunit alpha